MAPISRLVVAALAAALLLAGCAAPLAPAAAEKPRLVVFLVVDGLPQRQVVDYRDQLAPDGLRRFLERGAWFADAHYAHSNTQTAPGHATMLTGAYPHRSGIIANEWRDPASGELEYNTGDPAASYIGHKTGRLDGTSPKNLRAETVGDVLRRLDARSKVIGISGKDRGAILPAGHRGTAYMYQAQTGQFASTTYYMKAHPQWVVDFHARKPADAYFQKEWQPLLDAPAYARSLPDGQNWYAKWGGKLPMKLGEGMETPGPRFYASVLASPFGDELMLAFARAAIAGEELGKDDAPDILSVSLSSHDYINHGFSAESRISHDHLLHLDRHLERFFRDLDATVGKDRYLVALTADHGFMPAPELSQSQGRDSGRLSGSQLVARLNAGLAQRFGPGQWALGVSAQALVLNHALIAERKLDAAAMQEEARNLLLAEKAVAAAYTRREIETGSHAGAPFFEQVRRSWDSARSADIAIILKPYWMYSSTSATTHGSPHAYDTQVPILFYGPRWVKPGRVDARVEVADIAPTLARILGIPAPSSSEGKPLPLIP
jgi:predicted AlkP superfamily pyrophosphatase or phosphodiesterase